jgi:hypothetical protein
MFSLNEYIADEVLKLHITLKFMPTDAVLENNAIDNSRKAYKGLHLLACIRFIS